jgi:hypothetical protein
MDLHMAVLNRSLHFVLLSGLYAHPLARATAPPAPVRNWMCSAMFRMGERGSPRLFVLLISLSPSQPRAAPPVASAMRHFIAAPVTLQLHVPAPSGAAAKETEFLTLSANVVVSNVPRLVPVRTMRSSVCVYQNMCACARIYICVFVCVCVCVWCLRSGTAYQLQTLVDRRCFFARAMTSISLGPCWRTSSPATHRRSPPLSLRLPFTLTARWRHCSPGLIRISSKRPQRSCTAPAVPSSGPREPLLTVCLSVCVCVCVCVCVSVCE